MKDYFEGVKANATSSVYLMGLGKEDWEKELLVVQEPFETAASASKSLENLFEDDKV